MAGPREAYCTLLTSDEYLPGALVLAHSLRDNGTTKQLAVLVTLDSLSASTIDELREVYDQIIPVERIVNRSPANLYLMNRPDLNSTFTKIALWRQTQFDHIVYIDADVVALRAPDELFNRASSFAAAPDVGWPDCFNSGVLSLKPNMGDYYALRALADRGISFDGADQGLLNMHFRNWDSLSFTYNCTPNANYQYVPAYRYFQNSINMVHYIGYDKPWVVGRGHGGATDVYGELLGRWWAVYDKHFRNSAAAQISGQAPPSSSNVSQYVTGESTVTDYGITSYDPPPPVHEQHGAHFEPSPHVPSGAAPEGSSSGERGFTEQYHAPHQEAPAQVEQRRYSVDWDPQHQPPPPDSRPEAADLHTEVYAMSEDPQLFQPPPNPEPPKDMYYEVPQTRPAVNVRPPPIFPWEEYQPKPTRVFLEEAPAEAPEPSPEPVETTPSATTDDEDEPADPPSPTTPVPTATPAPNLETGFAQFSRTNAWDDMPEINRYISNLPQNRRSKLSVLFNRGAGDSAIDDAVSSTEPLSSPPITAGASKLPDPRTHPALRLTDFPTEIERPSLPVTPAPVRRPSFWGAERDEAGDLPSAEGVPDQTDWDPDEKLSELARRQSEVLGRAATTSGSATVDEAADDGLERKAIPDREVLNSASVPPALPQQLSETTSGTAAEAMSTSSGVIGEAGTIPRVTNVEEATSDLAAGVDPDVVAPAPAGGETVPAEEAENPPEPLAA